MPRRVNPIILLGFIIALVLSLGILASANLGGGTAGDAISVGEAQMGKPFVMATDGPNTFSCSGLMRYILRTIGVDGEAPWSPEGYLSKYAHVDPANIQPGDIVIYPNWATMYAGNGQVLNANEVLGYVTHTPMSAAGTPEGIVRPPYAQQANNPAPLPQPQGNGPQTPLSGTPNGTQTPLSGTTDSLTQPVGDANAPLMGDPSLSGDPSVSDTPVSDLSLGDPSASDLPVSDPSLSDSLVSDPSLSGDALVADPRVTDPTTQLVGDAVDPLMQPVDDAIDPLAAPVDYYGTQPLDYTSDLLY